MVSLYKNELHRIEELLNDSLIDVENDDIHQRYEIHKMVFNELMGMVKVYGPILTCIKEEYESLISHVLKTQQHARIMEEELKTACSYPSTILNYERKCVEQREKLQRLRREKEHTLEQLRDVQLKCQSIKRAMEIVSNNNNSVPLKIRKELRRLPCMSLSSLTDLASMQTMCDQLATQKSQLERSQATKYVDKDEEIQLESHLKEQIINYDTKRQEVKNLIRRKFLLQAALTKIRSLNGAHKSLNNIGEVIVASLINSARSIEEKTDRSDEDSIEDQINTFFPDPTRQIGSMKESDYIVLCIRQFEKLFQESKYKEAADLAVTVPKGVLRNYSTTLKFKNIDDVHLLYYCQQVISTLTKGHLDSDMSYECVDVALKQGRIDLVNLWISKGRIQSTELIADNLTSHADLMPDHKIVCLDLAAAIYSDLLITITKDQEKENLKRSSENNNSAYSICRRKYFDSILECRIKAGRIEEAIEMLTTENTTPVSARSVEMMYKEEDILLLIHYYPNIDLVKGLLRRNMVQLESVFNVLSESQSFAVFANLLIHTFHEYNDVSKITDLLSVGVTNGVSTEAWESMLNFVGDSNEKIIIEIAASYLVKISLERSCQALLALDFDI